MLNAMRTPHFGKPDSVDPVYSDNLKHAGGFKNKI